MANLLHRLATTMMLAASDRPGSGVTPCRAVDAGTPGPGSGSDRFEMFDMGNLLATGGVTQIEGAGGGGLVPWAMITGDGTRDSFGGNVHYTVVRLPNFLLQSEGAASASPTGLSSPSRTKRSNRSVRRDTGDRQGVCLRGGYRRRQGSPVRRRGLYSGQLAAAGRLRCDVQNGRSKEPRGRPGCPRCVGCRSLYRRHQDLTEREFVVGRHVRLTRANQFGLLGFGGDRDNSYQPDLEGSVA